MGGQSSTIIKNVCDTKMLYEQQLESISKTMNNINTKVETALKQAAANKVNLDNFNYKGYADRYIDLRTTFGYNKEWLYNHYLEYGLVEKRIG